MFWSSHTPYAFPPELIDTLTASLSQNPRTVMEHWIQLYPKLFHVYQSAAQRCFGHPPKTYTSELAKTFKNKFWEEDPYFYACLQSYLALSSFLEDLIKKVPMDDDKRREILFYVQQYCNALSPANFPGTNPEIFYKAMQEGPSYLQDGIAKLHEDWKKMGPSGFLTALAKPKGFEIGKNLAITPGCVVFRNDLFELIQYKNQTPKTYERPILLTPPWINKYYIFDLTPENSFVNWLCQQGFTVFIISWVNPGPDMKKVGFGDYIDNGLLRAAEVVRSICNNAPINALGYCLGGNLLACGLGKLKAEGKNWFSSATFLTTIFDFDKMDELGLFLQNRHFAPFQKMIHKHGVVDGYALSNLFSILRSNDLIWPALIDRYFLRKDPPALDFLYWNADPVALPAQMYMDFIEHMVHANGFLKSGGMSLPGQPTLDFQNMDTPTFVMAAARDHIAPYRSCFPLFSKAKGPKAFVLSTSGHIAGVINPPQKHKYSYFHLERMKPDINQVDWRRNAIEVKGSWWPFWTKWLADYSGQRQTAPPSMGSKKFPALDEAPGQYIHQQAKPWAQESPWSFFKDAESAMNEAAKDQ